MTVDHSDVLARPQEGTSPQTPSDSELQAEFPAQAGWLRRCDIAALALIVAAGVVLRFVTRSPMWLDEALTVSIAKLPIGRIPGALRHDGHPPLYYMLLHGWMSVFGSSNEAVRALSGVFGVGLIPVSWVAAKRVAGRSAAWLTVAVISILPFALRYSTEGRMYSLVMLLAVCGWLLVDSALRRPSPPLLAGLVVCTAALLWTHYWALWLGAAVALCLIVRFVHLRRTDRPDDARLTLLVLGALAVGALLFVPWVPTLLYQAKHTGTPWGSRAMPTTVVAISVQDLGGGGKGDQILFGWSLVIVALIGLFGSARDAAHVDLDLRGRREIRPLAVVAVLTIAIASVMLVATNSAFQSRYDAVWIPFLIILVGVGLSRLVGRAALRGAVAVLVVLAVPSMARNVVTARSQSQAAARQIVANGHSGDVVALCPDQLGPALMRELPAGFDVGAFPNFSKDPHFVDWVDYKKRTDSVPPAVFADALLKRAGQRQIFLVWSGTYRTHEGLCEAIAHELQAHRPGVRALLAADETTYENESVYLYPTATPAK